MAKKFPPGKCVYCLEYFENLTSDHVFPKSWYPETTPNHLEKWQVPSFAACNNKYGKLENDLIQRFGLCVDPQEFASLGISDKVLRALNPRYGKSPNDKAHREKRRDKIIKQLSAASDFPKAAFLPGFDSDRYSNVKNLNALLISDDDIKLLSQKLIKGITYIENKSYLDQRFIIEVFPASDQESNEISKIVDDSLIYYEKGTGIKIGIARVGKHPNEGYFKIKIWNRINIIGIVTFL